MFRVGESGAGGSFGLIDAGVQSPKVSKKKRTGDGVREGRAKVSQGPRRIVRISCKDECM